MKRYEVVVSHRAELMPASHIAFLARVSMKAARRLRDEFAEMLDALETSPFLFAEAEEEHIPEGYRKALFGKRYLAVFYVEKNTVYLDAVLDCRMDHSGMF